jgi:uncharacterized membrane protein YqhA
MGIIYSCSDKDCVAQSYQILGGTRFMKRVMFIICGLCWFVFGLGFGLFLLQFMVHGAGLQDVGPVVPYFGTAVSPGSVLIGLAHIVGLFMISALCFVIGIGLCSHGISSRRDDNHEKADHPK